MLPRQAPTATVALLLIAIWVSSGHAAPPPVSFELDVQPILAAHGCSGGACHGKARGQNGFQLSLLGFDPDFDYVALTRHSRGRRIFPAVPEQSLLLQKPTAQLPHGGGKRFETDSADYQTLLRWIRQGTPRRQDGEPSLVAISASPAEWNMEPGQTQQLVVTAHYSDSSQRDVSSYAAYQSNESGMVDVTPQGTIQAGPVAGEATIMARYMGAITVCHVTIPLPGSVPDDVYAQLPRHNFIDELVWAKLKSLGITPSLPADDATFLRRASIDIAGRLPKPSEVRDFLADDRLDKRARIVDTLLDDPQYADHWANKWADLLRPNPYRVGIKAVFNYDHWIRSGFRKNKPYDQFVRELITARGSTWHNGAVTLFRDRRSPDEVATLVSQLFLGVRLECAKCHHHPFEKWSQEDFYSFAAFFSRVGRKGTGLSPPISGGEEMVLVAKSGSVTHPLTGATLPPKPLFGTAPGVSEGEDLREVLADWITSDENPYFSQVIVNRVWADLMGRGLVEPVDDLRATNPPSNGPLLEALARDFASDGPQKYDLKKLIRTITTSYVYGLRSQPNDRNVADTRNYSRHYRQQLRAEVLFDAISDITGVGESFAAMPPGARANQLWTRRVNSVTLDTFGRPDRNQDPPCERSGESTMTQTLHLMNSRQLHDKIADDAGRAAELTNSKQTTDQIVEQIYLLVYGRLPDDEERQIGRNLFAKDGMGRRQATEDLMWALLNTPEFLFKD